MQQQAELRSILQTAQSAHLTFAQLEKKVGSVLSPAQEETLREDLAAIGAHGHHGTKAHAASSSLFGDIAAKIGIEAQTRTVNL